MVFGCLLQSTKTQNAAGEISFSVARKTVSEETSASRVPVSIPLQRTGGSQGIVTVFYMVYSYTHMHMHELYNNICSTKNENVNIATL